jgi:hypothetical protein
MEELNKESENNRIISNSIHSIFRISRATKHLIEINQLTDERINLIAERLETIILSVNLDVGSVHSGDKHNLLILIKDSIDLLKLIRTMPSEMIVNKLVDLAMIIIEVPE